MKRDYIRQLFGKDIGVGATSSAALEKKQIDYLIVLTKDDDIKKCEKTIGTVVEIASKNDGMVDSIRGNIIKILIGVPIPNPTASQTRKNILSSILDEVGEEVVVLHGRTWCHVGEIGTSTRKNYTAIIPHYKDLLQELEAMPWGTHREHDT